MSIVLLSYPMSDLIVENEGLDKKGIQLLEYVTEMCQKSFVWQSPANDAQIRINFTVGRICIQRGRLELYVDGAVLFCTYIWRGGLRPKHRHYRNPLVRECFDIISPALLALVDVRRYNKNAMNKREISAELGDWFMPRPLVNVVSSYAEASKHDRLFDYAQKMRIIYKDWKSADKRVAVCFSLNVIQIWPGVMFPFCLRSTSRFCECVLDGGVRPGHKSYGVSLIKANFAVISPAMLALIE